MTEAFITYSANDEPLAKKLHTAMTTMGVPTFFASVSIEPGQRWSEEIFKHLKNGKLGIFPCIKEFVCISSCSARVGSFADPKQDYHPDHD